MTQAVTVIADVAGTYLTEEDKEFLKQPQLGGLIFFARNYEAPQQLLELVAEIREIRPDFLLTVDQEGGRVQRFREGFVRLPAMAQLGYQFSQQADSALQQATALGWVMAAELIAHGVDLSFAPVLDVDYQNSSVIGDRAFAGSPMEVEILAEAFIKGMNNAGMKACGKHFPGHGHVAADSHLELPKDDRALTELEKDTAPFKNLIAKDALAAVMPAHVIYSSVDADNTAGFSSIWIQEILRSQLGFDGLIFSDDLSMQGAAEFGGYAERARCAVNAGANVLLACNDRVGAQQVIDAVKDFEWPLLSLKNVQAQTQFSTPEALYSSDEWKTNIALISELLA